MIAPEALCFYKCGLHSWIEQQKSLDTIVILTQIEIERAYVMNAWGIRSDITANALRTENEANYLLLPRT